MTTARELMREVSRVQRECLHANSRIQLDGVGQELRVCDDCESITLATPNNYGKYKGVDPK